MPKSDEQKAVSVYMPLELYQQLMEFKNQENLRSDSQAVNLLVERQLDDSTTPDRSKAPYQRLSQLEEMISDIASRLKQVESTHEIEDLKKRVEKLETAPEPVLYDPYDHELEREMFHKYSASKYPDD